MYTAGFSEIGDEEGKELGPPRAGSSYSEVAPGTAIPPSGLCCGQPGSAVAFHPGLQSG